MYLIANKIDHVRSDAEVRSRCAAVRGLVREGDYSAACDALGSLWGGVGVRPVIKGLSKAVQAEVLLWVGALTCYVGGGQCRAGSAEEAKALLFEAWEMFAAEGMEAGESEAKLELAVCYRREGALNEARDILNTVRESAAGDSYLRALAALRLGFVEIEAGRSEVAVDDLTEAHQLFVSVGDDSLMARYHNNLGSAYLDRADKDHSLLYLARAEFEQALRFCKTAGHSPHQVCAENNLALVLIQLCEYEGASESLDRARAICEALGDRRSLAMVEETRARLQLAENQIGDALETLAADVRALEGSDDHGILSEALCTYGIALMRIQRSDLARDVFLRAIREAELVGDFPKANRARAEYEKSVQSPSVSKLFLHWRVKDDSMLAAGLVPGKTYKFRASHNWKDGDVVAVETPVGKLIAYIHSSHPLGVLLSWPDARRCPKWFRLNAVRVRGVLHFIKRDEAQRPT